MFRFVGWCRLILFIAAVPLNAAGPDDQFIAIYNLIQTSDAQRDGGRMSDAYSGYAHAQEQLRKLQQAHPTWNERVINYRLRYVAEKLEALKAYAKTEAEKPAATTNAVPADQLAPSGEVITQFNNLNAQIRRLSDEKQLLEAKLREALSAQPAPVDPRELQAAVEKISMLQQTNKVLLSELDRQEADRKNLVEKVVAEEAQKALNEANRQLLDQRLAVNRLQKEKNDVEGKLKGLQDGTVKKLETENSSLKQQVVELKADTEKGKQVADLAGKLSRLQTQLDGVLKTNATLLAERSALEKQLGDAQVRKAEESIVRIAKLETDVALARADAARNSTRADELALALVKEKEVRMKVEQENKTLEDRIAKLGQSDDANVEVVKTLQSALSTEKSERSKLETELRAAEDKLAELSRVQLAATRPPTNFGAVAITPALTIVPPDPATLAKIEVLEADMRQLRVALKDSRDRETELKTALVEEETMRRRLEREKADLEKRLAAVPKSTGPDKSVALLETKVRELERQRDDLTKKLTALNAKTQVRLAAVRPRLMTPRDHAADFRAQRQSIAQ
jgi:hypothetical protein